MKVDDKSVWDWRDGGDFWKSFISSAAVIPTLRGLMEPMRIGRIRREPIQPGSIAQGSLATAMSSSIGAGSLDVPDNLTIPLISCLTTLLLKRLTLPRR